MSKSARILGQNYGLTAQEMNYLLKEEGFLAEEDDGYSVTDKGAQYATEKDYHRGTGGYAYYNRNWTTRSWDDSIEDALNITEDMIVLARESIDAKRKKRWEKIKAEREEADARFLENYNNNDNEESYDEYHNSNDSGALGIIVMFCGITAIGYGIYKAVPHVINWWNNKIKPRLMNAGAPSKTKKNDTSRPKT